MTSWPNPGLVDPPQAATVHSLGRVLWKDIQRALDQDWWSCQFLDKYLPRPHLVAGLVVLQSGRQREGFVEWYAWHPHREALLAVGTPRFRAARLRYLKTATQNLVDPYSQGYL